MIWFVLWLIFAVGVFTWLGWSVNITLSQRKAWSEFASKYKLDVVKPGSPIAPVGVRGNLQGRQITIYTDVETTPERRTQELYTMIEVFLNKLPPAMTVMSKYSLPEKMSDITLPQTMQVEGLAVAQSEDAAKVTEWLTQKRRQAIRTFMDAAAPDEGAMLISDDDIAFLLWRTMDPMRDVRVLNAKVQSMFAIARELE